MNVHTVIKKTPKFKSDISNEQTVKNIQAQKQPLVLSFSNTFLINPVKTVWWKDSKHLQVTDDTFKRLTYTDKSSQIITEQPP